MAEYRFCPLCARPLAPIEGGTDDGLPGCPTGHFVHYDNPAVTAFALIENESGRFLALRRAHPPCLDEWDMPGGFVDAGESPEQCVVREIAEETGLEVRELRVLGAWTGRYGPGGKWTVDVGFRCRLAGGDLRLSDEKSEAGWYLPTDFPEPAFRSEQIAVEVLRTATGGPPMGGSEDPFIS